jgi:hypothetical protein
MPTPRWLTIVGIEQLARRGQLRSLDWALQSPPVAVRRWCAQDYDYFLRIAQRYPIVFHRQVLAGWRYIDYNFKSDSRIESLDFNGPLIGIAFNW